MGTPRKVSVCVLTSSRADFGIYMPLIRTLNSDDDFIVDIVAFGTHLSPYHGHTIEDIEANGFQVYEKISSLLIDDDAASLASSYALTALKFADFWKAHRAKYDFVLCLGDRYEMAAAVAAGIPLGIRFAHIHGGETTLGAIDNVYRHAITLASSIHFVSAEPFARRIAELVGPDAPWFVTGALSLDNLDDLVLLSPSEFRQKWNIDLAVAPILVTIHPETVAFENNIAYAREASSALGQLATKRPLIITMPNADTAGSVYREAFAALQKEHTGQIHLIENFGTQSYFSAMKFADHLVGNTSSGIVEAASFEKYVVNIGDRQKGRLAGDNVVHAPFDAKAIVKASHDVDGQRFKGSNVFKKGRAADLIAGTLKAFVLR